MSAFPIGVMLDSFRKPWTEALDIACELGASGIQAHGGHGLLAVKTVTPAVKKEFMAQMRDHGLVVSAICGDLGKGFGNPELNPELIETSKRILDMAKELGTDIVTTHIGVVPQDPAHPRYHIMQDACGELAEYADSLNAHFAVETGPETAKVLCGFLDSLHSTGVSVNMDPANLVMVTGDDPVRAVHTLKKYIVHTHAKDGRKLLDRNPEIIYHVITPQEPVTDQGLHRGAAGRGQRALKEYLERCARSASMASTIEREVGENPVADIRMAANFLRKFF